MEWERKGGYIKISVELDKCKKNVSGWGRQLHDNFLHIYKWHT